jgi:hypothetical protein
MFTQRKNIAQSTAEYVIVLGLIVGAVVAMQTYIKRGMQGRIRDAVDSTDNANQTVFKFNGNQYEPYYLRSSFNTSTDSDKTEDMAEGGKVDRTGISEKTNRSGDQWIDLGGAENDNAGGDDNASGGASAGNGS